MLLQNILETQELYQVVINHLPDGIYLVDRENNILIWNDAAEKITGYSQEDMLTSGYGISILDHIDRTGAPLSNADCPIAQTQRNGSPQVCELFLRHKRGFRVPVLMKTTPIVDHDEVVAVMAVFVDNSVQIQQNEIVSSLTQMVMVDQLTGLSNKTYTETLLESRLQDYRLYGSKFGVIFINLDDFSICNCEHGYEVGNQMLVNLADSLRSAIRNSDFIGRWAGEEFVGVFETKSLDHLRQLAEKIRAIVQQTEMKYMGKTVGVTASVGATLASSEDTAKNLVERAASLMHVSKISGKNCATIG